VRTRVTPEPAMSTKSDPNLLKPQILSGEAVVRESGVKDLNHSPAPNEEEWYKKSLGQDAEITASQETFFATLRERIQQ
jgi:hypothetical protein